MRIHFASWGALVFAICLPATRGSLAQSAGTEAPAKSPLRNMLVINEDDSHFFGTRKPEDMTLDGLHAFVDQYANSAITHLFLCPNAMRASFRSTTRDAIWDPVEGVEPQDLWPQNGKRLFAAGLDPYAIWISRCREKNVSPWLSMRMNDVHSVDDLRVTSCTRRSGTSILSTGACRMAPPLRG